MTLFAQKLLKDIHFNLSTQIGFVAKSQFQEDILHTVAVRHAEESLSESDIERIDCLRFSSALLKVSYGFPSAGSAATTFLIITLHAV